MENQSPHVFTQKAQFFVGNFLLQEGRICVATFDFVGILIFPHHG